MPKRVQATSCTKYPSVTVSHVPPWVTQSLWSTGGAQLSCSASNGGASASSSPLSTPMHRFTVTSSSSMRDKLIGHLDPRLAMVLRSVMYVPPIAGSLIFAKNAICDTNMRLDPIVLKVMQNTSLSSCLWMLAAAGQVTEQLLHVRQCRVTFGDSWCLSAEGGTDWRCLDGVILTMAYLTSR